MGISKGGGVGGAAGKLAQTVARKGGGNKGGLRRKCAAFLRVEVPGDADKDALEAVDALMSLSSGYGNQSPNLHSAYDALPSLTITSKAFNAALEALRFSSTPLTLSLSPYTHSPLPCSLAW